MRFFSSKSIGFVPVLIFAILGVNAMAAPISRNEAEAIAGRYISVERGAELRAKRGESSEAMPYYVFNAAESRALLLLPATTASPRCSDIQIVVALTPTTCHRHL